MSIDNSANTTASIEVTNLSVTYRGNIEALSNVSFALSATECVGLIGPNGAGKSTLLTHLIGIKSGASRECGGISIFGNALSNKTICQIRRDVGLVFQDPSDQLFCSTVYEDVAFGPRQIKATNSEIDECVMRALGAVGLDTPSLLHRPIHHLSHGQKRRLCIAGVLACGPKLWLLDEPTSGLDPRGRRQLIELIRELPGAKIIATHDMRLVLDICPRAMLLDSGHVIADGKSEVIINDESLMLAHGLERP